MVFRVRAALTEEDREAWQRLIKRKKRGDQLSRWIDRIVYGIAWAGWLMFKFFGLVSFYCAVAFPLRLIADGAPLWLEVIFVFLSVVLIGCGIRLLTLFPRSPGRPSPLDRPNFLPSELPDTPVWAVFFGDGNFLLWDAAGWVRLGYSSILCAWEDEGRFYLFFRDRPPLVLPKRSFAGGTPEDFRDFLERELGWPVERIKSDGISI